MGAIKCLFLVLPLLMATASDDCYSKYANHVYMSAKINSVEEMQTVQNLTSFFPRLVLLKEEWTSSGWVPLTIPRKGKDQLIAHIKKQNISYQVMAEDLAQLIKDQMPTAGRQEDGFDFNSYHPLVEISTFINDLPRRFPNLVSLANIGNSAEGRPITVIQLNYSEPSSSRAIIFIECGIHAREWVSPAACLGVLNRLITTRPPFTMVFDFHVLIVFNVDGYVYSWEQNRLWRKNRQVTRNPRCPGVDLNRNFDDNFGLRSSADPCADDHRGRRPLDQPESQVLANYMARISGPLAIYFSVHSFSQLFMYTAVVNKTEELLDRDQQLVTLAANAIRSTTGTVYRAGPIEVLLGGLRPGLAFGGTTLGHVANRHQTPYSFVIELRDRGRFGFLLPPEQILGTTNDLYAGLTAVVSDRMQQFDRRTTANTVMISPEGPTTMAATTAANAGHRLTHLFSTVTTFTTLFLLAHLFQ